MVLGLLSQDRMDPKRREQVQYPSDSPDSTGPIDHLPRSGGDTDEETETARGRTRVDETETPHAVDTLRGDTLSTHSVPTPRGGPDGSVDRRQR